MHQANAEVAPGSVVGQPAHAPRRGVVAVVNEHDFRRRVHGRRQVLEQFFDTDGFVARRYDKAQLRPRGVFVPAFDDLIAQRLSRQDAFLRVIPADNLDGLIAV